MSEIQKLNKHTNEWNAIMPFFEWLSAHRMCIAKWRTQEEVGEDKWLLEHPYPTGNYTNLLYEYFEVNPNKLEAERRDFLKSLQETSKKNIRPTQGQPITPDIYGKLYPDLSATEIVKPIRETKKRRGE